VSDSYARDPARPQQWATFLGSLEHGAELTRLRLILAPLAEVQQYCGAAAYACYSSEQQTMVAPGEPPDPATSVESIVAHEYGHHIATNRSNPPWASVEYGTKRWASYERVCKQTEAGEFFPGAEDRRYSLNPGEGFAESYRVLNEHRLGLTESPWDIISTVFYPDTAALAAIEQDITSPWSANTVSTTADSFARRRKGTRTSTLTTSLDGNVVVTLRTPATLRARLDLLSGTSRLERRPSAAPEGRSYNHVRHPRADRPGDAHLRLGALHPYVLAPLERELREVADGPERVAHVDE
jgi:hypothetical protein